MNEVFKGAVGFARNPLGIIALFVSLIYGMSALLFGTSIEQLQGFERTVIVLFIVIFPLVVLIVFSWMVAKHHTKLYGPRDYQNDQGFLDTLTLENPASLGKRLMEKVMESDAEDVPEDQTSQLSEGNPKKTEAAVYPKHPSSDSIETTNLSGAITSSHRIRRTYLAENLIFQELQNEFSGSVRREVKINRGGRGLRVDGIITTESEMILVEVKVVRSVEFGLRRVREFSAIAQQYREALDITTTLRTRTILAVAIDAKRPPDADSVKRYEERISKLREQVELRIFFLPELLQKFGFPEEEIESNLMT